MDEVREVFDASTDFTIGLEEEFAILDPESLDLVDRYPELYEAAQADTVLAGSAAGELIASEIEIRSGRSETMSEAVAKQVEKRRQLFALAAERGVALASLGTHPWADYLEQEIIDTPHYQRLKKDLGWVARRNNTWSLHVHMGIRGADRAIAVCDRLRELLPILLATSANSIFLDRQDTGLASIRTEIFTRTFPRCGIPGTFRSWDEYAGFIDDLKRFGSIVEATQLWWSVRPHHAFGTVEVRICDAQTTAGESTALAALMCAVVAQAAIDLDEGRQPGEPLRGRRDRGEPLARDPLGPRGRDDRLPQRAGGADPRGDRADRGVDRAGARRARPRGRAAGGERGAAGARRDRRGAPDRGVLQARDRRDQEHLRAVFGRGRG